jgi:hypothetical protein
MTIRHSTDIFLQNLPCIFADSSTKLFGDYCQIVFCTRDHSLAKKLSNLFRRVRFFEKLFRDLAEVVDEADRRVSLKRILE